VGIYPGYARRSAGSSRQAAIAALRGSGEHMSMPQGGGSGQPWEAGQQAGAAQQQQYGQQYGNQPYGSTGQGGGPGQQYDGPIQGRPVSPVDESETRVTGRRVVQYIVDHIIVAAVWSLVFWALHRGHGAVHAILYAVAAVLALAWAFWYWAYRPYQAGGQTFGMQLMGIRVISKDGGAPSLMQFFIRAILLIVDELPFLFLVGFITVLCSRYRQRVGDHAANTMVVKASVEAMPARQEFAGAGQAGSR
jgi:uncharacterized RDD family membrane protein YckC